MCKRLLIGGNSAIATFQGTRYSAVSVDTRCKINPVDNGDLQARLLSFQDADKPGVMVMVGQITTLEFTDATPDGCLAIDYTDPEPEIQE